MQYRTLGKSNLKVSALCLGTMMFGDQTDTAKWWGHRFPRSEFEQRLQAVPRVQQVRLAPSGHMVHHDRAEELATALSEFLHAP